MDLIIAFFIFIAAMIASLIGGWPMVLPLMVGFLCFFAVGRHRGFPSRNLVRMAWAGGRDSLVVVEVLVLIGLISALWRSAGTITFFVYYGIRVITPSLFIIITFLLACLLSYALGTSFGVAGTVGVIFMALARSGDVNEIITAGAVLSGVFFGDRGSPVSSSALLVAAVTKTNIFDNVRGMMKSVLLPLGLSILIYTILSVQNPIRTVDENILRALETDFSISLWLVIPAALMLILPLFRINVMICMAASIVAAFLITIMVQGTPILEALRLSITGFSVKSDNLGNILSGGGVLSMLEVCAIVFISCSFSGIFSGAHLLRTIQDALEHSIHRLGKFGAMLLVSVGTTAIFCNQTIASIMCSDLMGKPYKNRGADAYELAIDIENSVIIISPLIPWCIASSVPLSMLGVGMGAIPYAVLLYLVPLCYIFTKRIWFKSSSGT